MADSSQKFIARNRAPRVQIEYDVELYGAEKKVQLPFVMGVMSDLAGQSNVPQPAVADRKFLEIDVDNFDERMRAIAPRAAFTVPNTLTGEGNLAVDLTFESMKDFTPGAIAAKVDALRPLLEARQQLEQLMTYMDGKTGAEGLIETVLGTPALLSSLAGRADANEAEATAALDSLRGLAVPTEDQGPETSDILGALAQAAPEEAIDEDTTGDILSGLKENAPTEQAFEDTSAQVLSALANEAPSDPEADNSLSEALDSLATASVSEDAPTDTSNTVLSDLAAQASTEAEPSTAVADALQTLSAVTPEEGGDEDSHSDVLADLARSEPQTQDEDTAVADALSSIAPVDAAPEEPEADLTALIGELDVPEAEEETSAEDVLAGIEAVEDAPEEPEADLDALIGDLKVPEVAEETSAEDVLAGIEVVEDTPEEQEADLDALIGDLEVPEAEEETRAEDVLAGIEAVEDAPEEPEADLDALIGDLELPEAAEETRAEDVLAGIEAIEDTREEPETDLDALLGDLDAPERAEETPTEDILAGIEAVDETPDEPEDDLDALLGDLDLEEPTEENLSASATDPEMDLDEPTEEDEDLDSLLSALDETDDASDSDNALDAPSTDDGDLDALLAGDAEDEAIGAEGDLDSDAGLSNADQSGSETSDEDLNDLFADLGLDSSEEDLTDDIDALFSDLEEEAEEDTSDDADLSDLDALLGGLDEDEDGGDDLDLDSLLSDLDDGAEEDGVDVADAAEAPAKAKEPELAYGTMSANRPEPQKLERKRFRLAVLGDFTGRAAKGQLETGDALAARKPMVLDPDTFEDVIESFATELVLPIGKEGAGISVKLGEFDDLHPDELFDNVALFAELTGLRKQLQSGVTKDHAMKTLTAWAEAHGTPARAPKARSGGNAVPADLRLSDFQKLIGDTSGALRNASPIEEMLARVVGPHIRALPDPNLAAMQAAVDEALSDAMRLVLHHPEFQSIEAQWRSLDLIQRSVEVDDTLEVILYDISAEELAADLAAHEDLSESGFVKLLTEGPMDPETGRGAYSALIGLYTFEETPPHAELLGRFARVAAHVDAPFLASITPGFWETAKEDRPKIVAEAWDTLSGMAEAGHLGLLTPRFLLRRPYGAKSEPIDPFDFEEFTQAEGLRGMLWGNPVVLAAILMAKSFKENGASLQLGSIMSLGDMPYHYVKDRFGDQVALPCTERNVDLDKIAAAKERGFMPIASVRGRDEIRLTSFNSLRGDMLLGPWTGEPAPEPSPPDPRPAKAAAAPEAEASDDLDLDDLGLDLDFDGESDGGDDDLDALLAGFGDDDDSDFDGDMDADLEALLNDL